MDSNKLIDIHNTPSKIKRSLELLKNNKHISKEQQKKFDRFFELSQLGKLGKKSGNHRILSYIYNLNKLVNFFKKDLGKISEKELETFYYNLEKNKIKRDDGKNYKDSTKNELVKSLKKYLKFEYDDEKTFRKNVGWMKDFREITEIKALNYDEVKQLANKTSNPRDKALILFLFDSGCRIEECLNLRFRDIQIKKDGKDEYYIIDIKVTKTLPRKISLPLCYDSLTEWIKIHPEKNNLDSFIFPIGYDNCRIMLTRLSKKVLGYKITLHQLRHSSASYYCKKINNPFKFVYRFGWTVNSDMAKRYIDRSLLEEDAQMEIANHIKNDRVMELENEVKQLVNSVRILQQQVEMHEEKTDFENIIKVKK